MREVKVFPVDVAIASDFERTDDVTNSRQRRLDADGIPSFAWSRNLAEAPPLRSVHQPARPPVLSTETISLLPLAARLGAYVVKERARCREPFFDLNGIDLRPPDPGPFAGVPLGGLGSGSINRGFRGDFRRWNVLPGRYIHKVHHACQFSLRVKHSNSALPQACVLVDGSEAAAASCSSRELAALRSWGWKMKPDCATYHALYPRAWTVYEEPLPGVRLLCRQISPVLGSNGEGLSAEEKQGEYVESSLPCAVFEWRIENLRAADAEVSLMFTWQADAGIGESKLYIPGGIVPFERCQGRVRGVEMRGKVQSRKVFSPRDDRAASFVETTQHLLSRAPEAEYEDPFSYSLACSSQDDGSVHDKHVTGITCASFSTAWKDTSGRLDASSLWASFLCNGGLPSDIVSPGDGDLPRDSASPSSSSKTGGHCRSSGGCCFRPPAGRGCSALCQHVIVPAKGLKTLTFVLSWDVPRVRFGSGKSSLRWYSRFCGSDGDAAPSIAAWALKRYAAWEQRIEAWQAPILRDPDIPGFYKQLIFNELYYISDGGSLWTDVHSDHDTVDIPGKNCLQNFGKRDSTEKLEVVDITAPNSSAVALGRKPDVEGLLGIASANAAAGASGGNSQRVGQFVYLEGHEYLMYNTYDVHFYASWALVLNWPQLQLSLQKDIIAAIASEDQTTRVSLAGRAFHHRKVADVVPHDVGSPSEEPFLKVNTYNLQDVSRWKDLGSKFVLQVYRDFHVTGDVHYLRQAWSTMLKVMASMDKYDRDSDGLIENDGFPDQTYDIWTVTGASAYTGGLWVAALSAMVAAADALATATMAQTSLHELEPDFLHEQSQRFKDHWIRARHAYVAKLWHSSSGYFHYDSSGSGLSDSCMSDQCAGQWWARACGLPAVCDEDLSCTKACSALLSVLELNVYRFGEICAELHGQSETVRDDKGMERQCFLAGAVNGMRPGKPATAQKGRSGATVDNSCVQSREVWTGTSYGLAAAMLLESRFTSDAQTRDALRRGAFDVAKGIHRGGWNHFGYWFATPEAWEATGNVRCMGYMRPLSIWGMQWALSMRTG